MLIQSAGLFNLAGMDAGGSCPKEKDNVVNRYDIWTNMANYKDLVDELEKMLQVEKSDC